MRNKRSYVLQLVLILVSLIAFSCSNNKGLKAPNDLTICEGFSNPIGFYNAEPTFSWKLSEEVSSQSAYEIAVATSPDLLPDNADLWKSGNVKTDQSLYVKYGGKTISSRQKVYWQVRYWDEKKRVSNWSNRAYFELGLLKNADWEAQWIGLPGQKAVEIAEIKRKVHKVQYLRKEILLKGDIAQARLYLTAKGLFKAHINGAEISNDELTPGWTSYEKRIETITYDVSKNLIEGTNCIGIELAEGWHSGRLIFRMNPKYPPRVLAQLEVTYSDGKTESFVTDDTWKGTTDGPIQYSGLYDGERYDANFEMPGWNSAGYNDKSWVNARSESISDTVLLAPKRHQTVTTKLVLPTKAITEVPKGRWVFDLGQNMAGVPLIKVPVKKNQKVTIRFAEMLQHNGEIYTKNYRSAVSTDFYIPAVDGVIEWQPKFTFHGFRYVELSGFDETFKPEKSWVEGLVRYSDFEFNGSFSSSHEKLNQLQSNIEWGLRGNFLDIPTDCPQRDERAGWTGDAQVFIPTSLFIADAHSFWASWMQSIRDDQRENGSIPIVVPDIDGRRVSSGWGDVATVIPWETYFRTGDVKILKDSYSTMMGWINYYQSVAQNHIPEMFTYGDWLQPYSKNPKSKSKGETDEQLINTAYYARSVDLTLKTAKVLKREQDVEMLETRLKEIKTAFQNHFFDEDGMVIKGKSTQTAYLLAIGFSLLTPEMEKKAIPHLLDEINKAENHLRTGFLGTPLLAPVLEQIGRTDLMYQILFKESYPSWFYSINQGATTMWERWNSYTHKDGFNKGGMNSFNHYAYGAIGQWMYERIAGLKAIEPGYKKIQIAPVLGGPLTSAKAEYNSPYGKIVSAWKVESDVFELITTIPPNTEAKIMIPANTNKDFLLEGQPFNDNSQVKLLKKTDDVFELSAGPGSYIFTSNLK